MAAPRKYPDELRERAIREVRTTGRPIAHVARDLGIHKEALRGWVRQAEADRGERDDRLTTAELDELKQLRRRPGGPADRRAAARRPVGRPGERCRCAGPGRPGSGTGERCG
ncbi:transposase [Streptomyces sp. RMIT01]